MIKRLHLVVEVAFACQTYICLPSASLKTLVHTALARLKQEDFVLEDRVVIIRRDKVCRKRLKVLAVWLMYTVMCAELIIGWCAAKNRYVVSGEGDGACVRAVQPYQLG